MKKATPIDCVSWNAFRFKQVVPRQASLSIKILKTFLNLKNGMIADLYSCHSANNIPSKQSMPTEIE